MRRSQGQSPGIHPPSGSGCAHRTAVYSESHEPSDFLHKHRLILIKISRAPVICGNIVQLMKYECSYIYKKIQKANQYLCSLFVM